MDYFHSVTRRTPSVAAALLVLAATTAQADVQAGNYQTHNAPSTTRHVVQQPTVESSVDRARTAAQASVEPGNYQTHTLAASTRRANTEQDDVAMTGRR